MGTRKKEKREPFGPPGSLCAKYLDSALMKEVMLDEESRKVTCLY
jgi:hypothetical protein